MIATQQKKMASYTTNQTSHGTSTAWEIIQIKRAFRLQRGVDITKEQQSLGQVPVVSSGGISSYHNVALAKAPGVVIGRKGTLGSVYYLDQDYWPHDTTLWVVEFYANCPRFVFYKLLSMELEGWDTGSANPTLNRNLIHPIKTPWPPIEEQKIIAQFLDRKTTTIDTLIAKKKRLIELLEEKRSALINQAVTKGVGRSVRMKDSGVSWIGEIPEHWEVKRSRWAIQFIDQGRSPLCDNRLAEEDEWGVLKVGCVNGGVFDELEHKALPIGEEIHPAYEVHNGDILVSRANTKDLVGSTARVVNVRPRLLLCDKLYRLKLKNIIDPNFFVLLLGSQLARCQFESESSGSSGSMQNISQEKLRNLTLSFPPYEEQKEIAKFLRSEFQKTDNLKLALSRQIEKLREYRQSLITAAVTGKLAIPAEEEAP